ncbi:MAG: hypothetical protein KFH87_01395, partial [Bacteroidetes bacterium]|nr:hypothetical protein [Bacteroidota bacterium]
IPSMQLKRFLDCPYAFFLHDILHIHPPPPLTALPEEADHNATESLPYEDNTASHSLADDADRAFTGNGPRLTALAYKHVSTMIRAGCFPHTDLAQHCQRCSYQAVCMDTETVNQEARTMLANPDEHILDTWRALREIPGIHGAASTSDESPAESTDALRIREADTLTEEHSYRQNDGTRDTAYDEDYGSMWQCAEVRAVFSVFRALSDPENPLPVVSFLRGPLCGADDAALLGYHRAGGHFAFNARAVPGTDERVANGMQFLKDNVRLLRSQPPGTVVATILDRLALHALAVANAPDGQGADAVHLLAESTSRFSRSSATFAEIVERIETQLKKK